MGRSARPRASSTQARSSASSAAITRCRSARSQALAAKRASFGVLHFDAHSDTRRAYEGFEHSHASIMFNVLERIPQVTKLVQVGIRDVCEQEIDYCKSQGARVRMFSDRELREATPCGRAVRDDREGRS